MARDVEAELGRLRPRFHPFQLVAGVPLGGLHIATAYSLSTNIPLIYTYKRPNSAGNQTIEGHYEPDLPVLIIDDLITTGGSVLETAQFLQQEGLQVKDVMVLIDRGEGATTRLRHLGYSLYSLLTLEVMLNYYLSTGRIDQNLHRKCCQYIAQKRNEHGHT
jgi:orotate phosphoribosyltransferase/uridine monophosphate synthetase